MLSFVNLNVVMLSVVAQLVELKKMVTWPSFPGCHPLRRSPVALERQERLQADVNIMKLFSSSLTPRNGTVVEFSFILSGNDLDRLQIFAPTKHYLP